MKKIKTTLTLLFIIAFSGCSQRDSKIEIQDKLKYIKQQPYDFQIVDISGASIPIYGTYISSPTIRIGVNAYVEKVPNYEIRLASNDVSEICVPYLDDAKFFYKPVIGFYEFQINEYNKLIKEENGKD